MLEKNEKLVEKFLGQLLVQGARDILSYLIITKDTKMRPYLNFIKDKEVVISMERKSCTTIK